MKKSNVLLLAIGLLALFLALWTTKFWNLKDDAAPDQPQTRINEPKQDSQSTVAGLSTAPATRPVSGSTPKLAAFTNALNAMNVPISFWGKVVDQDDRPVAGATVTFAVRRWTMITDTNWGTATDTFTEPSSAEGLFSIQGATGDSLEIRSITRSGYELAQGTKRSYGYNGPSFFAPDPQSPILFRMWRSGPKQPLISKRWVRTSISPDGTPTFFGLVTGQKSPSSGDLRVSLTRSPLELKSGAERFAWEVKLEMPDGGLCAADDVFLRQAPVGGYNSVIVYRMTAQATNWVPTLDTNFYVSLNNAQPQFGRIKLRLTADIHPGPCSISLESYINPTGDRSLEGD